MLGSSLPSYFSCSAPSGLFGPDAERPPLHGDRLSTTDRWRQMGLPGLIGKVGFLTLERMLKADRKRHEERHGQKRTYRTPEPRAKRDREEHGERVDLKTPTHQRGRDELTF